LVVQAFLFSVTERFFPSSFHLSLSSLFSHSACNIFAGFEGAEHYCREQQRDPSIVKSGASHVEYALEEGRIEYGKLES